MSASREVELTNLDRVLFPATGYTKRDVIDYYRWVAPVLLPHLAGRPVTLGRFPAGIDAPGFATTECQGRPDWVHTHPVRLRSGVVRNYCGVEDLPSLLWVANLGTIELHAFPAGLVLDLDPGPQADVLDCGRVALRARELLAADGVDAVAKTTGSRGLHLHAPVRLDRAAEVGRALAGRLSLENPDAVTASREAPRGRRVLIDWRQSNPRMLTILPYSLRATNHPSVATPLRWAELEAAIAARRPGRLRFSPGQVLERCERMGDPMLSGSRPARDPR